MDRSTSVDRPASNIGRSSAGSKAIARSMMNLWASKPQACAGPCDSSTATATNGSRVFRMCELYGS
jgi:hypothetical protein